MAQLPAATVDRTQGVAGPEYGRDWLRGMADTLEALIGDDDPIAVIRELASLAYLMLARVVYTFAAPL